MKLTSKEKWAEIAEAFATLREDRTYRQVCLTNYGLCYAFGEISERAMTGEEINSMVRFMGGGRMVAGDFREPAMDAHRANMAGLFAAMTDKERAEVLRGY